MTQQIKPLDMDGEVIALIHEHGEQKLIEQLMAQDLTPYPDRKELEEGRTLLVEFIHSYCNKQLWH
jgi:hypothetical protein